MDQERGARNITSLAVGVTIVSSTVWMAKETMRSAVSDVGGMMQLTKIEAVSRNRDCHFVIDTATGTLEVRNDEDELLHSRSLPANVVLDRPDLGSVVTLELIDASESYQAVFTSDGVVSSGAGAI